MSAQVGQSIVFGIAEIRPIEGVSLPCRVRLRAGKPATATVRTGDSFEHFLIQPANGTLRDCTKWKLGPMLGASRKS